MKIRPPKELGDAMLIAAAVMTLVLAVTLYAMLPTTTVNVETAATFAERLTGSGR
jgi:hypothetical protein